MKHAYRLLLTIGWLVTSVFCTASTVWAVQSVDTPKTNPDAFFTNEATTITVAAQIAVDSNLIPGSVRLVRVNASGQTLAVLGQMYDDGTHGDALLGDGTYTAQITLNEASPSDVGFMVTAGYRGTMLRAKSPAVFVPAVHRPTNAEIQQLIDTQDAGAAFFVNQRTLVGDSQARLDLIAFLKAQPGVTDAGLSEDNTTVWTLFNSGLEAVIITNPDGTKSGNLSAPRLKLQELLSSSYSSTNLNILSLAPVKFTKNAKGIALAPWFDQFSPLDETDNVANSLSQTCGGPVTPIKNGGVTVNVMKTLRQYGVISISSHGAVNGNGQAIIETREAATLTSALAHLIDVATGRIERSNIGSSGGSWAITPKFIQAYAGGGFPDSLVYVSACYSTSNNTMANAFLNNGAKAYLGFSDLVNTDFSFAKGTSLFDTLTDHNLNPEDRTVGKAFDNSGGKVDPTAPHAVFQLAAGSDRDLALINDLVVNGGFESGDLTGWTPDTTFGYVKASIDDHTDGSYSGRIGRWDQPYQQGGCFRCGSVPGAEPDGEDFIYQDVDIPNDATGTFPLEFDYNVVTYDGADYDWFDMEVRDANTNALLTKPVNHVGGIISGCTCNWGLFYTTGWRHVSVDLSPYRGRKVRLLFRVTQDGFGDQIATYIDQVSIGCQH
jgi:hypothetical protein